MKFVLKPSLEQMALVKIDISLWNLNYVRSLISKLNDADLFYGGERKNIEERIIGKVSQLPLPELLKEKMFGVIEPIGKQIFELMENYRQYDYLIKIKCFLDTDLPLPLPAKLCWTSQGTIDRKKTAELSVRDENLNVSRRYMLACQYCLEDDIILFWNRLPEDMKEYNWNSSPVVCFWSDYIKRGGVGHVSYKDVFYQSAIHGDKAAVEYFLLKLTAHEREETLVETAKHIGDADVLSFLLSQLNEEQQMEVFKFNSYRVLWGFLEWPWQSFFIEIANCMWNFIPKHVYRDILGIIINTIRNGDKDWNYLQLLREFWKKSPSSLKDWFIDEIDKSSLLLLLFLMKDKETIRLILKDATVTAKTKLIYSNEIKKFCQWCISDDEWDFLEFFIQECFPSKTVMLKFKEEFEKHIFPYFKDNFQTKKHKWDEMFSSSGDSIFQYSKRDFEEGEISSSKRFHSLQ